MLMLKVKSIPCYSATMHEIPVYFFLSVASKMIAEYHFLKPWKLIFQVSGPHQRTDWALKEAPSSIRLLLLYPRQKAQLQQSKAKQQRPPNIAGKCCNIRRNRRYASLSYSISPIHRLNVTRLLSCLHFFVVISAISRLWKKNYAGPVLL